MNRNAYIVLGGCMILAVLLMIPVRQNRVLSYGVDTYSAHAPLYGNRTASQAIHTSSEIMGLGVVLVDLRRSNTIPDVQTEITDAQTGKTLVSEIIPAHAIKDDAFAPLLFAETPISPGRQINITFSASQATNQNPIGVRFDPDTASLALSLYEQVPAWKFIATTISSNPKNVLYVLGAALLALLFGCTAFLPNPKKYWWVSFGVLLVLAFTLRAMIIPEFGGVSGGDAYNYLSIADAIREGQNPFANTKRLPGYPLLLTPLYSSGMFDDQQLMRYIQAIASIGGVILLAGIARSLQLSWPVAFFAGIILAFQKDYFMVSVRPEPYGLYTAFLLASVWLFFLCYATKKFWTYLLFGLVLGYSAMTRQEGFVAAAVLGACSLAYEGFLLYKGKSSAAVLASIKRLSCMYFPALAIVLPFFIHNAITYGHPLYTEYLEGDRLQIVDSYLAFQDALSATWGVIGSMWKPAWDQLARLSFTSPLFIASAVLLWAWYAALKYTKRTSHRFPISILATTFFLGTILFALYSKSSFTSIVPIITAAWVIASIPLFVIETRFRGAVILVVLISQIGIATWFHPFPKHYQQSYPFIVLILATALLSQVPTHKKIARASTLAAASLPFLLVAVFLSQKINAEIDNNNHDTALDSVTYRAARTARSLPGPIGFDQAYLPARLYFDPDAKYFPAEDNPTEAMEQRWLESNPVKTFITTNADNVFKKVPPHWQKVKRFKAEGNDEKVFESTIYSIP